MQQNSMALPIQHFQGFHLDHCRQCDSQNSSTQGFDTTELMHANTYHQLMDRGWRRRGTYFFVMNNAKSCCLVYTIRLQVAKFRMMRRSHRKAAKKLLQLLSQPIQNLPQSIRDFKYVGKNKGKEKSINQQQQQQQLQQQSKQQVQQVLSEPKVVTTIAPSVDSSIKLIFANIVSEVIKNPLSYLEQFKDYFTGQQIDLTIAAKSLTIDPSIVNQVKIFTSQGKQKGDYYSNFLMMLYGRSKKTLFQKLSVEQYCVGSATYFLGLFSHHTTYNFSIDQSGYLNIYLPENAQKLTRLHPPKPQAQKLKGLEKPLKESEPIKLITFDEASWSPQKFMVETMTVVLKKAEFEKDAFLLYAKYCQQIHDKKNESEEGYNGFLCQQSLQSGLLQSQVNKRMTLFLGCYHMCYYIQDKLIAVGVVDITERCMSSVYLFYDPDLESKFKFGTFTALIEIEYIQIMNRYHPQFQHYYLGFYIQTTPKMVYKGEFEPSELLCPLTYTWVALDDSMRTEIDKRSALQPTNRKLRLSNDQTAVIDDMDNQKVDKVALFKQVKLILKGQTCTLQDLNAQGQYYVTQYLETALSVLGRSLLISSVFTI